MSFTISKNTQMTDEETVIHLVDPINRVSFARVKKTDML